MGLHGLRTEPGSGRTRSRRATGALLIAALLSLAVALAPVTGAAKKHKKKARQVRPNIVLVMDDDQSVNLQQFLTSRRPRVPARVTIRGPHRAMRAGWRD